MNNSARFRIIFCLWASLFIAFNAYADKSESISLKFIYQGAWYKTSGSGVSTLSMYQEPYDGVNPSVFTAVYGGPFKTAELMFKPVNSHMQANYKGVEIVSVIKESKVGNYGAYHQKAKYSFIQDGKEYPTVSDYWMIPRGQHAVLVMFSTSQADESHGRSEAMKIINSLQFIE